MLPSSGLGEESRETTVGSGWGAFSKTADGLVTRMSMDIGREGNVGKDIRSNRARECTVPLSRRQLKLCTRLLATYSRHFRSGHQPGQHGEK